MDHFTLRDGQLHAEDVPLASIARSVGTPCFVYSRATLERHWRVFDEAFGGRDHLICYSVKANSNLAVLGVLAALGSGFDIVSGGELERVIRAGGEPRKTIFSGVGKSAAEIRQALQAGVMCLNVESQAELARVNDIAAELGVQAPVAVRVNPDVDANTHPYIATGLTTTKFGIPMAAAPQVYQLARSLDNLHIAGIACHIGSQLTELGPYTDALGRIMLLWRQLREEGIELEHVDLGGGLGIRYEAETPPSPADYVHAMLDVLDEHGCRLPISVEPGRVIAGNAGVLLTRVEYLKTGEVKNFAVVDAAMNDFLRPALYRAWHEIVPVSSREEATARVYDVVGPVCETADCLGHDRRLAIAPGDLLALRSAGAYGAVMSSNYNSRPRPAEVMVDGDRFQIVRERETLEQLMDAERLLNPLRSSAAG
ncbi:MAG: diaminopimelate decarboxylase [Gammaproteobacteria bacterium]|nr:diaminopimelate decarboxylase [Gammaproteobacteria bacterium]